MAFKYKGPTDDEDFSKYGNVFDLLDKIRNGNISLNEAKKEQEKFKVNMREVKKVSKNALKHSLEARKNIIRLYHARNAAIDFSDEYTLTASQARCQLKQEGTGLKM